jgi:hypothetical protein
MKINENIWCVWAYENGISRGIRESWHVCQIKVQLIYLANMDTSITDQCPDLRNFRTFSFVEPPQNGTVTD